MTEPFPRDRPAAERELLHRLLKACNITPTRDAHLAYELAERMEAAGRKRLEKRIEFLEDALARIAHNNRKDQGDSQ
jgi:hypothetical protein